MNKNLPKSIDEIEYVPFVGREIDLNTKGKPSVYLRNVIIPYYRKVIRGLETDIKKLKTSKKKLLDRKNHQILQKRWLKYKSNQVSYAVMETKVKHKAVQLTERKARRAAFKNGDMLSFLYILPVMDRICAETNLRFNELAYICFTWNFSFLHLNDYKKMFGVGFKMSVLNKCRKLGYIDSQRTVENSYYLSVKGKSLIKRIQEESEKLKDE